jgi:hypothetical protein
MKEQVNAAGSGRRVMGHQFTDGKMAAAQRSLSSCRNKQISLGADDYKT